MKILDRYLVKSLLVNYVIALAVMMSLYTVLDLFFNIDEFTEADATSGAVLKAIANYYGAHVFLYFSQLSGVITLFACMVTLARMRRANELTAILASGVSLYRVAAPIVAFGLVMSVLWYVDTEILVPKVAHRLARDHDDALGDKARGLWFVNDGQYDLLSAIEFVPVEREMRQMLVLHRDANGGILKVTEADLAVWEDIPEHPRGGVWRLSRGIERQWRSVPVEIGASEELVETPVGAYESELDPEAIEMRQARQWIKHSSSRQLDKIMKREPTMAGRVQHVKHSRFATPLVHLLLLFLGLPFFLSREPANILNDAGNCVAVCGLCFLVSFASENFVTAETLSALPAWLPIILFSPVAVILIDRIKT
jgi:lipopolysaccharide export LptBFGC system permease protein LptF